MGKAKDYFPSPYLKGDDFDQPVTATITQVHDEKFDGDRGEPDQIRPVVKFKELDKGLVLNKTNFEMLVGITGQDDTDNWAGNIVELRGEMVMAFGKATKAVRVYQASGQPAAAPEEDLPF